MNIKENYLSALNQNWSNEACIGYVIVACKNSDISHNQTNEIISQLNIAFSNYTLEDAKNIYINY